MIKQGSKRKPNKNFRATGGPKNRISLHSGTYWPVSILIKEIFMGVPPSLLGPFGAPWGFLCFLLVFGFCGGVCFLGGVGGGVGVGWDLVFLLFSCQVWDS